MALDPTPRRFLFLDVAMKFGVWNGATAPTQFYDPVNFTKLEFTVPAQEIKRITSRMEGSIGGALATVQRPTGEPGKLSAEFDAASPLLIGLALGADVSELAVSSSSVTDEAVITVLNKWVPLANQWIDADTFVLETPGTPDTVIAATKYEIDAVNGLVKAIHADAVGAKEATYDVVATAGETYDAGQAKSAYVQLIGTGTEHATAKRCRILVARANLAAAGALDLVAGGALKGVLEGELETPSGYASPWTYQYSDRDSTL